MILAMFLTGCGDEAVPPPRAGAAPSAPARPNEAMLARLRVDDPVGLRAAAGAIAASGDLATRRAASARLVAQVRAASSPAALAQLLAAMEVVGGPEVVAYCLSLGEYDAAPIELRKGALAVLIRWADRNDPTIRARSAAIWTRVNAAPASPTSAPVAASPVPAGPTGAPVTLGDTPRPPAAGAAPTGPAGPVTIGSATTRGGTVANATPTIAGMAAGFRRCYDLAVQENAASAGTIEVTVRIDPSGTVSVLDESHTGLTSTLVSCVVTRVQAGAFAAPQGGAATVVIPIKFEAR
jgi:hypothetical protein